jgi:membrane associated rhomboid family serine protease
VTIALIALNLVVFVLVQPQGDTAAANLFEYRHAAIPCELSQGSPLTFLEANNQRCGLGGSGYTRGVNAPEIAPGKNVYLAMLVSMFLHGSWLHVLGNMLFLWVFGNNVEDRLGHVGFAVFYLFLGALATTGYALSDPSSTVPVLGASGAIAGIMGAYLVFWPRARVLSLVTFVVVSIPAAVVLGIWFVLQFFTDPNTGVAWVAHVTGFVAGALFALILRFARPLRPLPPHPGGPAEAPS